MQVEPQIAIRNFEAPEWVEADVRGRIRKLEEFCDRITSCHVTIEVPHHHHRSGNQYRVAIRVAVPRRTLAVDRVPAEHVMNDELAIALREAFDSMRRQIEDYAREIRGDIKPNVALPHARVWKLFPEADYGFLKTPDGREIFFHAHSVLDGFDRLTHDAEVRYIEEEGEKGPQATSIHLVGRHGHSEPAEAAT